MPLRRDGDRTLYTAIASLDFRNRLSQSLNHVMSTGARLLITRNGKDAAALVTVRDLDALERVERNREDLMQVRHEVMMREFRALKEEVGRF